MTLPELELGWILSLGLAFIVGYFVRAVKAWSEIDRAYNEGLQDGNDELPNDIKNYLNDQI